MAAIVENSDDAIIGSTLERIITSWNPAAELMFGYSSEEIVGRSARLLTPQDRADESVTILARIGAGQHVEHLATTGVRKDGTLFPVSLTASPIRDPDGAIVGTSAIVRDMTEEMLHQKDIATQLAKDQERLAELEASQRLSVGRELELKKEIEYLRRFRPAGGGELSD
jgi:PAS domain S-box-containing protein